MHTILVIAGGFLLLLAAIVTGRMISGRKGMAVAAWLFIPVWLSLAIINMWVGMAHAGYTFAQEAPILVLVFGVPAAVAAAIGWKFLRAGA